MTNPINDNTESNSSAGTQNTENMVPQSRFSEVTKELRAAQAQIKQLLEANEAAESQRKAQTEKELAEQNQYKQLYENLKAELESKKAMESDLKRYQESLEKTYNSRVDQIPEENRYLIPKHGDLFDRMAWLDEAYPRLVAPPKPNAPRLDGGSGGTGGRDGITSLNTTHQDLASLAQQSGYAINKERLAGFVKNPTKQSDLDNKGDKP